MPKIQNIPNHGEESFGINQNYGRLPYNKQTYLPIKGEKFRQQNNNYSKIQYQNDRTIPEDDFKSFYDDTKVVPIHQVKYNPQFSKSPLASVVMNKNSEQNYNYRQSAIKDKFDQRSYSNDQNQKQKCNPVLLAILGILALIGLLVGIFFIFKSLSNKNQSNIPSYNLNDLQDGKVVSGEIKPIQIQPVPFYKNTNSQNPYSYNSQPSYSSSVSNSYVSSVSSQPMSSSNQYLNPPQLNNINNANSASNQQPLNAFQNKNINLEMQNSISPINVYPSRSS